jgi:hypothetical protein
MNKKMSFDFGNFRLLPVFGILVAAGVMLMAEIGIAEQISESQIIHTQDEEIIRGLDRSSIFPWDADPVDPNVLILRELETLRAETRYLWYGMGGAGLLLIFLSVVNCFQRSRHRRALTKFSRTVDKINEIRLGQYKASRRLEREMTNMSLTAEDFKKTAAVFKKSEMVIDGVLGSINVAAADFEDKLKEIQKASSENLGIKACDRDKRGVYTR